MGTAVHASDRVRLARPPGPKGHWLTGHLRQLAGDRLAFLRACAREYGDVVHLRFGRRPAYLLSHPDLVEAVLVTHQRDFVKSWVIRLLRPVLGDGLLTSDGDHWLRQRRLVQPAFHRARVAAYADTMVRHAERMLAGWRAGETRDVHAEMTRLTLGIVAETLFGADVSAHADRVARALSVLMASFTARRASLVSVPLAVPTPGNLALRRATRRLDALVYGMIRDRRAGGGGRDDALSLLLEARDEADGRGMTDRQVRDELITLFLAGHETTANALSWTWYLLARHPAVGARLAVELRDVLGGRAPAAADLPRLAYADAVVREAMRLYPPAHSMSREPLREVELGGYRVPPGTMVFMSPWVIHRDGRFFDDPEAFAPDRWMDGLARRLPRFAYFPFGGGPRVCIGSAFATMEAVLLLATIAARFRPRLAPGEEVVADASVTLRPRGGVRMVLDPAC
jgi:cytochrome P450